jgi:hypothetical protein
MWRFLCLALLALAGSGCSRPAPSTATADAHGDPKQRIADLVHDSFDSGPIGYLPEGRWIDDKAGGVAPERVHGVVGQ